MAEGAAPASTSPGPAGWRRLTGASGANLTMHVGSQVLGLVTGVVLGRLLGAAELGVYAFTFAVANVAGVVARLGLENLIVREVAIARERQRFGLIRGLLGFAERSSVAASLGLGALAAGIGWVAFDPGTAAGLACLPLLLVAMSGSSLRAAGLRGLGAVVRAQVPLLVVRPVAFLGLVAAGALVTELEAWHAIALHGAAFALAWAAAGWAWSQTRPTEVAVAEPEEQVDVWLRSAGSLVLIGTLSVLNSQADLLLLKGLASDASTGIYSVCGQLSRVTSIALAVVNGIVAPRFAALHVRGEREALQRLVTGSAAAITAATVPAASALVAAGPWLLGLYADEFVAGYPALVVLVAAQIVNAVAGSVGNLLIMTGHEREVGLTTAATVALNVALNVVLVPRFDLLGAAIGSAAGMVAWNLFLAWRVRRLLGIDSTALGWLAGRLRGRRG